MNETSNHNPLSPTPEEDRPEVEPTLDLDLDEFEEVKDLQASLAKAFPGAPALGLGENIGLWARDEVAP